MEHQAVTMELQARRQRKENQQRQGQKLVHLQLLFHSTNIIYNDHK